MFSALAILLWSGWKQPLTSCVDLYLLLDLFNYYGKIPLRHLWKFLYGVCVIWLYENYFNFVKQTMILWFARGYLYFRRCVLNGLEVACYKICNLLLHKLAKVCTSDVCKLYGYTCVCIVYVGCFLCDMDGIHYILHVCTLHLMYVYMCVCVVWHVYFSLIPSSLFILPNTDQVSGETGGRKPHISNPWSVVQSKERVMNIHCDRFNFSLNSEY